MAAQQALSYKSIQSDCQECIRNGTWPVGDRLPTIREMALRFKVNYNTAQRAFAELQREGFISCEGRHGCFVSNAWAKTSATTAPQPQAPLHLGMVVTHDDAVNTGGFPPLLLLERLLMARVLQQGGAFTPVFASDCRDPAALLTTLGKTAINVLLFSETAAMPQQEAAVAAAQAAGIHCLVFSGTAPVAVGSGGDRVCIDDLWAFAEITRRLWQMGHRRIGFVGMPVHRTELLWNQARETAWRTALQQLARTATPPPSFALVANAAVPADVEHCSALVCVNDDVAAACVKTLRQKGINVPEDVSVTGYDNLMSPEHRDLTTFSWPDDRLAETILDLCRQRLNTPPDRQLQGSHVVLLRPMLVARGSWCDCPAAKTASKATENR